MGDGITRPDWSSPEPDGGHIVGVRSDVSTGAIYRRDWGDGDHRQATEHPDLPSVAGEDQVDGADAGDAGYEPDAGAPREIDPAVANHFAEYMEQAGASPEVIGSALQFLESTGDSTRNQPVRHAYDFRSVELDDKDREHLDAFGNAMSAQGATQEDVNQSITWYQNLKGKIAEYERTQAGESVADNRAMEAQTVKDRDAAVGELRQEWAEDFDTNIRTINRWLETLPDRERRAIETSVNERGVVAGNDPARLRQLLDQARNSRNVPHGDKTRADILRIMKTNRAAYDKDVSLQDRYRQLLQDET